MSSESLSAWGLVFLGVAGGVIATWVSKASGNLLKSKSIKEVVDSANAIIEMYEKHIGALETKVNGMQEEMAAMSKKLDETLKHNEVLQRLLASSQPITLPDNK